MEVHPSLRHSLLLFLPLFSLSKSQWTSSVTWRRREHTGVKRRRRERGEIEGMGKKRDESQLWKVKVMKGTINELIRGTSRRSGVGKKL